DEGTDTVKTALSTATLGANVENLVFIDEGSFVGTGNALDNAITGGGDADTLDGGAGADTLTGGDGDDLYLVDDSADVVVEAADEGTDTVAAMAAAYELSDNIENLVFVGEGGFAGT